MVVHCDRCDRCYRTQKAFQQHIRDSPNHHECPVCDFDGTSWNDLLNHCDRQGCRTVCWGCNNGTGSHWVASGDEYWQHVDDFNVCGECDQHFSSPSNKYQHQISHRTPQYDCYRCTAKFKTYGGMIIHLEYGTCSNINRTYLNKLAAKCRKWRYFIDEDCRDDLLNHGDTDFLVNPFMCPTCNATVPKLSSLFQHIESSACEQTLHDDVVGQLRRFLESRLS